MENPTDLIEFTRKLVQTKSYSGQEKDAIYLARDQMFALGFDEVLIDRMGNLLGRIGNGPKTILFDLHIDTVTVNDESTWIAPPFAAEIIDRKLYGRGAVDMKSGIAASIFAAAEAKEQGWLQGKSVYLSCTVFEEDCDGESLKHLFAEQSLKPNFVVICEPSENRIATGHKGKAQIEVTTHGISAHGSAPEKGRNAIYEMAEIIQRVERINHSLFRENEPHGTLVLSRISSTSASLNAVPTECEIYLDRRMILGETREMVESEMDSIIDGKYASWSLGTLKRTSWTGMEIVYEPLHQAWEISKEHELTQACLRSYAACFPEKEIEFDYWDFSTNAVTPVSQGIPTIGFGSGEYKLAHMDNEHVDISQISDACCFYTRLIKEL